MAVVAAGGGKKKKRLGAIREEEQGEEAQATAPPTAEDEEEEEEPLLEEDFDEFIRDHAYLGVREGGREWSLFGAPGRSVMVEGRGGGVRRVVGDWCGCCGA